MIINKTRVTNILILSFIVIVFQSSCEKHAVPATYYIPENFNGTFAVIYSQKDGCPVKIVDQRRQLHIPDSGILLTQFNYSDGIRDDIFLLKRKNGFDTLKYFLNKNQFSKSNKTDHHINTFSADLPCIISREQIFDGMFFNKNMTTNRRYYYELIKVGIPKSFNETSSKDFEKHLDNLLENDRLNSIKRLCN